MLARFPRKEKRGESRRRERRKLFRAPDSDALRAGAGFLHEAREGGRRGNAGADGGSARPRGNVRRELSSAVQRRLLHRFHQHRSRDIARRNGTHRPHLRAKHRKNRRRAQRRAAHGTRGKRRACRTGLRVGTSRPRRFGKRPAASARRNPRRHRGHSGNEHDDRLPARAPHQRGAFRIQFRNGDQHLRHGTPANPSSGAESQGNSRRDARSGGSARQPRSARRHDRHPLRPRNSRRLRAHRRGSGRASLRRLQRADARRSHPQPRPLEHRHAPRAGSAGVARRRAQPRAHRRERQKHPPRRRRRRFPRGNHEPDSARRHDAQGDDFVQSRAGLQHRRPRRRVPRKTRSRDARAGLHGRIRGNDSGAGIRGAAALPARRGHFRGRPVSAFRFARKSAQRGDRAREHSAVRHRRDRRGFPRFAGHARVGFQRALRRADSVGRLNRGLRHRGRLRRPLRADSAQPLPRSLQKRLELRRSRARRLAGTRRADHHDVADDGARASAADSRD